MLEHIKQILVPVSSNVDTPVSYESPQPEDTNFGNADPVNVDPVNVDPVNTSFVSDNLVKKEVNIDCEKIYEYIDDLSKTLNIIDKKFYVWMNDKKFKIFAGSKNDIEAVIKCDIDYFKDQYLGEFYIRSLHKTHGKKQIQLFDRDTWLSVFISIYKVDSDGTIMNVPRRGGCIWNTNDFDVTKPTNEVLYFIMLKIYQGTISLEKFGSDIPISMLVNKLSEENIDFGNILQPLM